MKSKLAVFVAVIITATCSCIAHGADKTFPLVDKNVLTLLLPDGWKSESDSNLPPTITLKSPAERHISIQITPLMGQELTDDQLKGAAKLIREHWPKDSAQPDPEMQDIRGKDAHGYVVLFTDNSPKRLSKYIAAGAIKSGATTLAVRGFFDDRDNADHTTALEMLKTFSIKPAQAVQAKDLRVTSPDGTWAVVIPGGWKVSEENRTAKGKVKQITASSGDGELMMTLFIEPADNPQGDASAARDYYLAIRKKFSTPKNSDDDGKIKPKPMEHLTQQTVGEAATIEYDQGDEGFKEHNLNAYLSHAGSWVDLHIYQSDFDPAKDRAVFDAIVKGLKIEPVAKPVIP